MSQFVSSVGQRPKMFQKSVCPIAQRFVFDLEVCEPIEQVKTSLCGVELSDVHHTVSDGEGGRSSDM